MKIEKTRFGSITIDGKKYNHDIYINIDKVIVKRKKELSRPYSRGHTVLGPEELKLLLDQKPEFLVIGKGQYGILPIPEESRQLLSKYKIEVIEDPTPKIIPKLNELLEQNAKVVAILHLTC